MTTQTEKTRVVQAANGKPRAPDSYEMNVRTRAETSTKPPRSNPPTTPKITNLDDSRDRQSSYRSSANSEPESSYF